MKQDYSLRLIPLAIAFSLLELLYTTLYTGARLETQADKFISGKFGIHKYIWNDGALQVGTWFYDGYTNFNTKQTATINAKNNKETPNYRSNGSSGW